MAVYLSYFVYVALGLVGTVFGSTLPFLIEKYSLSLTQAGTLFLFSSLGHITGASGCALLMRQLGDKQTMFLGALLMGAAAVAVPFVPVWSLVLLSVIVLGGGWGMVEVGFNALVVRWAGRSGASALNRLHLFYALGSWLGPLAVGVMLSRQMPWQWIFYLISGCYLLFLLLWAAVPKQQINGTSQNSLGNVRGRAAGSDSTRSKTGIFWLLRAPGLVLLGFIMFLYVGVEVSLTGWIATFLTQTFRAAPAFGASGVSMFWAGLTLGRWLCSLISDRFSYSGLLLLLCSGAALTTGLAALMPTAGGSVALFAITGVFSSGVFPMIMALGTRQYPQWVSEISGFLAVVAGVGAMVMPWALGAAAQDIGLRAGIVLLALIMVVAVVLVLVLKSQLSGSSRADGAKVEIG